METVADGVIPPQYIAVIMAGMDFVAFFGGLLFVHMKFLCGNKMRFLAPVLFLAGYILLALVGVMLADHIIVADGDFVSMADSGFLTG